MKSIFKALKRFLLTLIISLAAMGMGVNGVIFPTYRKDENNVFLTEQVEVDDEESEIGELKDIS